MLEKDNAELKILAVVAVASAMYFSQPVLFPLILSFILYFLFRPFMRYFSSLRVPKTISAAFIILCSISVFSFTAARLIDPAQQWLDTAPENLKVLEKKLAFLIVPMEKISDATEKVEEMGQVREKDAVNIKVNSQSLGDTVMSMTGSAFTALGSVILMLYFLLVYGETLLANIGKCLWPEAKNNGHLLDRVERSVSQYLVTITCINIILGLVIAGVLALFSVPNPLLWGVMAGVLNFVPYLGAIVGSLLVFLVSLLSFDSIWQSVLPPLTYYLINSLEGQVITPVIIGRNFRLNPFVILVSLMIGGWAWGIEGALLSVPMLAIFKIVCSEIPSMKNFEKILEG